MMTLALNFAPLRPPRGGFSGRAMDLIAGFISNREEIKEIHFRVHTMIIIIIIMRIRF